MLTLKSRILQPIQLYFTFVFFDKFFAVMVSKSNLSPFLGAWIPNFVFLLLAFYFLKNAIVNRQMKLLIYRLLGELDK